MIEGLQAKENVYGVRIRITYAGADHLCIIEKAQRYGVCISTPGMISRSSIRTPYELLIKKLGLGPFTSILKDLSRQHRLHKKRNKKASKNM